MNTNTKPMKWYIAYQELADALYKFYLENKGNEKNKKDKKNAGQRLYDLCIENKEFLQANDWINDFDIHSIEPFHIFVSLNGNTLTHENRIKRIFVLFKMFKIRFIRFSCVSEFLCYLRCLKFLFLLLKI